MILPERFGRYEVEALIGEGSMGRVFRARDPLGRRAVAVKILKPEYLSKDTAADYVQRFQREARAAGSLSHPCIITIFDVGDDFFVMELLDGVTLHERLNARGKLGVDEALAILTPVADAIDYAHSHGTVHRDIKPGNIMVLPDGRPKLMDFGVAHLASTVVTAAGEFLGSPSYMAPEQIARSEVSPRTDLFSLAVVAYEMLTGARPFEGDSITAIIYRVVHEEPAPPTARNLDLPPEFDEIFRRALAKDPALRFPSARAFVTALEERQVDIVLPPPRAPEPVRAPLETLLERSAPHLLETHDLTETPQAAASRWGGSVHPALGAAAVVLVALGIWALPRRAPPEAPPAAAVAPTHAGLEIQTQPGAASILLDGAAAGSSPLRLTSLAPGPHSVRVTKDGYAPADLSLELAAGPPIQLRFNLQRIEAGGAPVASGAARPAKPSALSPIHEGDLVELGPGVRPPARIAGDSAPYPEAARRLKLQGLVDLQFVVNEKGEPTQIRLLQSASAVLDESVIAAVQKWRFAPATKDGVKVSVRQQYRQRFVTEK
jgi:serine/threonine-protein kinase